MRISVEQIKVDDSNRQRKSLGDVDGLALSISKIGLLHPLVVDEGYNLIAGRRRYEAIRQLGWQSVEVTYKDDLSVPEKKLVEFDENLRRQDITWQERALALLELHELLQSETLEQTADRAGLTPQFVSRCLQVGKELRKANPKVLACTSINQAAELLLRRRNAVFETALSKEDFHGFAPDTGDGGGGPTPLTSILKPAVEEGPSRPGELVEERERDATRYSIICGDFTQFARSYSGPRFNFIHCDFPYGIGFDKSDAAGAEAHETQYEDSAETFWSLTRALFANQDRLVLDSAHMLFWFSMNYYTELLEEIEANGWFVHPIPLVWHKSDGMGIASDHRRRPKHIYETALWCSRGDRKLVTLRNDLFAAPLAKGVEGHVSAKPQAMLEYFLGMGVNDLSDVLDPTCGSGTAIRAAARLGASRALGLELNRETAEAAQSKLQAFRLAEKELTP